MAWGAEFGVVSGHLAGCRTDGTVSDILPGTGAAIITYIYTSTRQPSSQRSTGRLYQVERYERYGVALSSSRRLFRL